MFYREESSVMLSLPAAPTRQVPLLQCCNSATFTLVTACCDEEKLQDASYIQVNHLEKA